jgi:quinol monooxygenase YgiN
LAKLHVVGTFPNIDPAKLTEFKKVVAQAIEMAKGEQDTLQYEYFMSPDETTCVVLETYASSEALLAHMAGMGTVLERLLELGGELKADFFGDPSPALVEATAAFKPKIYASIGGK